MPLPPGALSTLAQADLAAVLVVDADGRIVWATPSAEALLGGGAGELLGERLRDLVGNPCPTDDLPHVRARHERVFLRNLTVRAPEGLLHVVFTSAPIPGGGGQTVHVVQEAGPGWHQAALAASSIGIWSWEADSREASWSDQVFRITGLPVGPTAPPFAAYLEQVHPDDRDRLAAETGRAFEMPGLAASQVHRLLRPDGTVRWVDWRGRFYRDADGQPVRMVGTLQDITHRKQMEQAARVSESRLAALLRNTPGVALQGYDLDGRVVFWNPASEAMFGWSEGEAVGKTLDQLIHTPEETESFRETLREVLQSGPTAPAEFPFRRKDGQTGWCLSTVFQISGPDEDPLFICMDVDRTDSRRMQERVAQAERLESLGRLAGGVAHDFNNLLTSILGFTDLALEEAPDRDLRSHLAHVREAAQRGAALTQQLLAYARRQVVQPRRLDVNALLRDMAELLPRILPAGVHLRLRADGDLPSVRMDPVQFDQIILNLVINAGDAMPEGGVVTLSSARAEDGPPGDWVRISVEDEGPGIPEAHQPHIFDPFFTTKPAGRGTGLGLATCYGIVHQLGGQVRVDSRSGQGTRFHVYLPVDGGPIQPPSPQAPEDLPGGHETVLIVEDDPDILKLAVTVLQRRGYRVLVAMDGEEALAVARGYPHPIHVLFSDLVIPRGNGRELADRLKGERPTIRVLLASGYPRDITGADGAVPEGYAFLHKPYTPAELARSLRALLTG